MISYCCCRCYIYGDVFKSLHTSSDLAQALCRAAAVRGAVFALDVQPTSIHVEEASSCHPRISKVCFSDGQVVETRLAVVADIETGLQLLKSDPDISQQRVEGCDGLVHKVSHGIFFASPCDKGDIDHDDSDHDPLVSISANGEWKNTLIVAKSSVAMTHALHVPAAKGVRGLTHVRVAGGGDDAMREVERVGSSLTGCARAPLCFTQTIGVRDNAAGDDFSRFANLYTIRDAGLGFVDADIAVYDAQRVMERLCPEVVASQEGTDDSKHDHHPNGDASGTSGSDAATSVAANADDEEEDEELSSDLEKLERMMGAL